MSKLLVSLLVVVSLILVATPKAWAHVLITDSASHSSAVLHIDPNDDPEAGKPATFFYELQTKVNYTTFSEYRLHITDEDGHTTQLAVTAGAHSITAQYIFPTQGLYKLELKSINPWKTSFDLRYSLRISRGTVGGASSVQKYAWTQPLLLAVGILFLLLIILFVNNAKAIALHSRF